VVFGLDASDHYRHLRKNFPPEEVEGLKKHLSEVRTELSTSKHEKELAPYVRAISKALNKVGANSQDQSDFSDETNGIDRVFGNVELEVLGFPAEIETRKNDLAALLESLNLYKDADGRGIRLPSTWNEDYRNWRLIDRIKGLLALRRKPNQLCVECSVTEFLDALQSVAKLYIPLPKSEDLEAIRNFSLPQSSYGSGGCNKSGQKRN
jgi:hypothetical protein